MDKRGLTLIEVLLAIFITALIIGGVFSVYPQLFEGVNILSLQMRALGLTRSEMETLKNTSFDSLFSVAYDPATESPLINTFTTSGLSDASGVYYVEKMHDNTGTTVNDLVRVEVVICFKLGNRVIGEDRDLDGALDAGEDENSDGKITSPVNLRTLVMKPLS